MNNFLHLKVGQVYQVKKLFIDFDGIFHDIGEIWTYQGENFLAHADGLTLHVLKTNKPVVYRLQWHDEEQAEIIENFTDYVEPYK